VSRELQSLVDRREDLVAQRTSTINRLRGRIHELEPAADPKPASLHRERPRALLADWLATRSGLLAELARDELADITRLSQAIDCRGPHRRTRPPGRSGAAGPARLRRTDRGQTRR